MAGIEVVAQHVLKLHTPIEATSSIRLRMSCETEQTVYEFHVFIQHAVADEGPMPQQLASAVHPRLEAGTGHGLQRCGQ